MILRGLAICVAVWGGIAEANAPATSLRPVAREDVFPVALPTFAPLASLRPIVRPKGLLGVAPSIAPPIPPINETTSASLLAPRSSLRPMVRPTGQRFVRKTKSAPLVASRRETLPRKKGVGKMCRDRDLQGEYVGRVPAKLTGCGARDAIKLHSVAGVALSTPAVMECDTARALKSWIKDGVDPAVRRYGGGVVKLKVAAGYSCRTRNSKKGAKISEHGKGRAIDISGFVLKDGSTISVLNDWGKGKPGRILKDVHTAACGPFGTVLGPNADRYHRDHFHFDVARYRSGSYCR